MEKIHQPNCLQNIFSVLVPYCVSQEHEQKNLETYTKINSYPEQKNNNKKSQSLRKITLSNPIKNKNSQYQQKYYQQGEHKYDKNKPISNYFPYATSNNNQQQLYKIKQKMIQPSTNTLNKPNNNIHKIKLCTPILNNELVKQSKLHKLQHKKQPIFSKYQQYNNKKQIKQYDHLLDSPQLHHHETNYQINKVQQQITDAAESLSMIKQKILKKTKQTSLHMTEQNRQSQLASTIKTNNQYNQQLKSFQYIPNYQQITTSYDPLNHLPSNPIPQSNNPNQNPYQISNKINNLYTVAKITQSKLKQQQQQNIHQSKIISRTNSEKIKFCAGSFEKYQNQKNQYFNQKPFNLFQGNSNIKGVPFKTIKNQLFLKLMDEWQNPKKSSQHQTTTPTQQQNSQQSSPKSTSKSITNRQKSIYDQFIKINYLGVGRFASVYLCCVKQLNFIFATKQILKFTITVNKIQEQLKKQISIQYSCNHPHILNLYHAWSDSKKYYIAIQYGQQTLLNKIQKQGMLQQNNCIHYLYEIIQGLDYLHQNGIIHRDIKPQNIIMVNNKCKIGDFGFATTISSGDLDDSCGTPCYISPQIENSERYTYKADCWSLGVLAYELINGKLAQNFFNSKILTRDNLSYKNGVSEQYKELIYNLLAPNEEDRPSTHQLLQWEIFK